jgi:hypothetical protein
MQNEICDLAEHICKDSFLTTYQDLRKQLPAKSFKKFLRKCARRWRKTFFFFKNVLRLEEKLYLCRPIIIEIFKMLVLNVLFSLGDK